MFSMNFCSVWGPWSMSCHKVCDTRGREGSGGYQIAGALGQCCWVCWWLPSRSRVPSASARPWGSAAGTRCDVPPPRVSVGRESSAETYSSTRSMGASTASELADTTATRRQQTSWTVSDPSHVQLNSGVKEMLLYPVVKCRDSCQLLPKKGHTNLPPTGSLYLLSLRSNGIQFINEDDCRSVLLCFFKGFPQVALRLTSQLAHDLRT